jgi:hypothetical protein
VERYFGVGVSLRDLHTRNSYGPFFLSFFVFLEMGMPEDYDLTINAALPIIPLCTFSASETNMVLANLKVS